MNHQTVEHLFRHEFGQLVALLSRRVGAEHVEAAEDAVQWAMAQALEKWTRPKSAQSIPKNPSGWLYQVSYRYLISELRATKRKSDLLKEHSTEVNISNLGLQDSSNSEHSVFSGELKDSLLKMLFFTSDNAIPVESQLVFMLKSLCGFSVKEIAVRLFISEENTYKRYNRARNFLKEHSEKFREFSTLELSDEELTKRLPSVHRALYLVFTEGYFSSHSKIAIRRDLCEESLRLALILFDSKVGSVPETSALIALMYFHLARMHSRQMGNGALQLLEEQDRSCWDKELISRGLRFLHASTGCESISRYHIEAGIAAEHCMSKSYKETRWENIVESYLLLEKVASSPIHLLNRAIAMAEWKGAEAGISVLRNSEVPAWLEKSYHWYAVLADLSIRSGDQQSGSDYAKLAIDASPNLDVEALLKKRFSKHNK